MTDLKKLTYGDFGAEFWVNISTIRRLRRDANALAEQCTAIVNDDRVDFTESPGDNARKQMHKLFVYEQGKVMLENFADRALKRAKTISQANEKAPALKQGMSADSPLCNELAGILIAVIGLRKNDEAEEARETEKVMSVIETYSRSPAKKRRFFR